MALVMGTAAVPGSATVPVLIVPAGPATLTAYQIGSAQPVYLGLSPSVSSSNGLQVTVSPGSADNYIGSKGAVVYATTGNATASSFSYLLSTNN